MISRLIEWCARNRFLVFAGVLFLLLAGIWSLQRIPLDALPDIQRADALVTLPMRFRLAVYYRDIAGVGCREIAEIMACCKGTVSSRLHRGRQLLLRTTRGRA